MFLILNLKLFISKLLDKAESLKSKANSQHQSIKITAAEISAKNEQEKEENQNKSQVQSANENNQNQEANENSKAIEANQNKNDDFNQVEEKQDSENKEVEKIKNPREASPTEIPENNQANVNDDNINNNNDKNEEKSQRVRMLLEESMPKAEMEVSEKPLQEGITKESTNPEPQAQRAAQPEAALEA